jgi:hypothetical protein
MPPPGGMAGRAALFFGNSTTMASVVIRSATTEAALWIAVRTNFVEPGAAGYCARFGHF